MYSDYLCTSFHLKHVQVFLCIYIEGNLLDQSSGVSLHVVRKELLHIIVLAFDNMKHRTNILTTHSYIFDTSFMIQSFLHEECAKHDISLMLVESETT